MAKTMTLAVVEMTLVEATFRLCHQRLLAMRATVIAFAVFEMMVATNPSFSRHASKHHGFLRLPSFLVVLLFYLFRRPAFVLS